MSDTKLCPYCGEEVKTGALKCKHCHSMLEGEQVQSRQQAASTTRPLPNQTASAKKPIYKRWWVWAAGIFVLFVLIASAGGGDNNSATSTPGTSTSTAQDVAPEPEPAIVPIVVTTDNLIDDLRDNALKAASTYNDQYVELTGKLSNIDSSGKYFSLSKLADDFSFDSVLCRIDDNHLDTVMDFTMGQTVTVTGKITAVGEVLGYTMKVETIK